MAASSLCTICEEQPESIEHALFLCPWAAKSWFVHPMTFKVNHQAFTSLPRWLDSLTKAQNNVFIASSKPASMVAYQLWFIWKSRCQYVFEKKNPDPFQVAMKAYSAALEFRAIPKNLQPPKHHLKDLEDPQFHSWNPPKQGTLKVNTDASWDPTTLTCGLAAIIRNSNGEVVGGATSTEVASSALNAEALAIGLGLSLASSSSLTSFSLESDSLSLISTLLNPLSLIDWTAVTLLTKIRSKASHFSRVNWLWTSRKANEAANWAASLAKNRVCPLDWFSNPPSSLSRILLYDAASPPP